MIDVQRYDTIALPAQSFERTPQGGIRAPARFTRVGVLDYELPDGTKRREWRPPEEVFAPESMATLEDVPITVHHPKSGEVHADSYQSESVGHVRAGVGPEDGQYLGGKAVIQDESTVRGALSGSLGELSAGYKSKLEMTPGVVPEGQPDAGQPYDCIQRQIRYNHVAILPPGLGRAGKEVALRLDSNGHQIEPTKEDTHMELTPEELAALKQLAAMAPKLTALVGAPAPVPAPAPAAPTVDTTPAPAPPAPADEKPKTDTVTAPAEPEKKTDAKDKPMTPQEQERIVLDSIDLRDKARTVLGSDYSFQGKTNRDVMTDVVKRVDSTIVVDQRSDEALRALFDMALPRFGEQQAAQRAEHLGIRGLLHTDAKDEPGQKHEQAVSDAWKTKSA